jgi:phosphatidylinositol dimannoside acyltransferase
MGATPDDSAAAAAAGPPHLLERWLLPALAAVLPWRACFRLYRAVARAGWLFRAETEAAHEAAARYLDCGDAADWRRTQRLVRLVDQADYYLSRHRGDGWLDRHVVTRGAWPGRGEPFLALGYHWGAGLWALRALRRAGHGAAFLSAEVDARQLGVGGVALRQARRRMRELERAGGLAPIYLGGASAAMQAVFARGDVVVALIDVPPRAGQGTAPVTLLGRAARLPDGLLRLAQRERVPLVPFAMGVDPVSGQRRLDIGAPIVVTEVGAAARAVAAHLDPLLARESAAWHLWSQADAFFGSSAGEAAR